jgi:hypothetical protein
MDDRLQMAGNILSAASFFAGLVLAYLGSTVTGFSSYDADQQNSVRSSFKARAWLAFVALVVAVASGGFALLSDWRNDIQLLVVSVCLLAVAAVAGIVCAFLTVREVQ